MRIIWIVVVRIRYIRMHSESYSMDLANFNIPDCPYYLISRVNLVVSSALKRGFAEAGAPHVRPAYLGVLIALWTEDGLKTVDLAHRAGLETSSMTGLLDRMERDRLLRRDPDPNDRRAHQIHLTEEGRAIRASVTKVVENVLAMVFQDISDDQLASTKEVLRRVLANANEGNQ